MNSQPLDLLPITDMLKFHSSKKIKKGLDLAGEMFILRRIKLGKGGNFKMKMLSIDMVLEDVDLEKV